MNKFEKAVLKLPTWKEFLEQYKKGYKTFGKKEKDELFSFYQASKESIVWKNDIYTIIIDYDPDKRSDVEIAEGMEGKFIHLSIKRNDKEPVHDWRDLQTIKNELIGEENEALEIFPAESRLVDMSNQYHLWVYRDSEHRMPIGFKNRGVGGADDAEKIGAKQRDRKG